MISLILTLSSRILNNQLPSPRISFSTTIRQLQLQLRTWSLLTRTLKEALVMVTSQCLSFFKKKAICIRKSCLGLQQQVLKPSRIITIRKLELISLLQGTRKIDRIIWTIKTQAISITVIKDILRLQYLFTLMILKIKRLTS